MTRSRNKRMLRNKRDTSPDIVILEPQCRHYTLPQSRQHTEPTSYVQYIFISRIFTIYNMYNTQNQNVQFLEDLIEDIVIIHLTVWLKC